MIESVIYSTENGNLYLYDVQHMFSLLVHPELGKVHEKHTNIEPYYLKNIPIRRNMVFGVIQNLPTLKLLWMSQS